MHRDQTVELCKIPDFFPDLFRLTARGPMERGKLGGGARNSSSYFSIGGVTRGLKIQAETVKPMKLILYNQLSTHFSTMPGFLSEAATTPDSVEEVQSKLMETVGGLWEGAIERAPFLVAGILVLFATAVIVMIAKKVVKNTILKRIDSRESLQQLILRFVSILIWFFGFLIAAVVVFPGLDPAKALGGLGLLSVAVGLAFQDIFENFFAGILLLWKFPFENGDFIECEGIFGKVENIQIRMTTIRKTTGELVVVPNSFLFKNPVEVVTDQPIRRVNVTAGVGYGEDVGKSIEVIQKAVEACETVEKGQPIQVYASNFGASSVDIDVNWWTSSAPGKVRHSKGEIIIAIKAALDEAGIEIPFPYRTLTFAEPLSLVREE